ncbi:MAG: dTDP-4-keto-6-deoxy-D-glucose epimerase [Deltaproteobacteria bacterium]|nr:dTDP-4-keto-6-deoxy-D-glucose epimerase [Deltaproteobacteria bacterium]
MRHELRSTPIEGVWELTRLPFGDHRGYFERLFCPRALRGVGGFGALEQVNHSLTARAGTVRGLHAQRGDAAETKIVTCLRGRVLDVAVDARPGSPTFGRHHRLELSEQAHSALIIPRGCLHGFQALTDACELLYFHDAPYVPEAEVGVHPLDSALHIKWPLPIAELSERDSALPMWRARLTD